MQHQVRYDSIQLYRNLNYQNYLLKYFVSMLLDVDECSEGLAGCNGPNQVCINTRGSYKCNIVECPRYFALSQDSLTR